MLRFFALLLFLFVAVLGLSFASLNAVSVPVNLYVLRGEFPLSLVMALSFASGLAVALSAAAFALVRLSREARRARRETRRVERELHNLRNAPIKDLD